MIQKLGARLHGILFTIEVGCIAHPIPCLDSSLLDCLLIGTSLSQNSSNTDHCIIGPIKVQVVTWCQLTSPRIQKDNAICCAQERTQTILEQYKGVFLILVEL